MPQTAYSPNGTEYLVSPMLHEEAMDAINFADSTIEANVAVDYRSAVTFGNDALCCAVSNEMLGNDDLLFLDEYTIIDILSDDIVICHVKGVLKEGKAATAGSPIYQDPDIAISSEPCRGGSVHRALGLCNNDGSSSYGYVTYQDDSPAGVDWCEQHFTFIALPTEQIENFYNGNIALDREPSGRATMDFVEITDEEGELVDERQSTHDVESLYAVVEYEDGMEEDRRYITAFSTNIDCSQRLDTVNLEYIGSPGYELIIAVE